MEQATNEVQASEAQPAAAQPSVAQPAEIHRKLVSEYVEHRKKYEEIKATLNEAQEAYKDSAGKLAEFMMQHALKTLKYDDLGAVTLKEPIVRPNVLKENEEKLFEFVKSIGRGEVIKASIHPSTLGSLIKSLLSEGQTLPEFVGYYLEPSLMYRAGAGQGE